MADYKGNKHTLCWTCQRAVRKEIEGERCPWSHDFKPVEGWEAEQKHRRVDTRTSGEIIYMDTYNVKSCPLYLEDDPKGFAWTKCGLE